MAPELFEVHDLHDLHPEEEKQLEPGTEDRLDVLHKDDDEEGLTGSCGGSLVEEQISRFMERRILFGRGRPLW